jgi:hypothetical protein
MAYPGGDGLRNIEGILAYSLTADANISTPTAAAGTAAFRMTKVNADMVDWQIGVEDDAAEYGKGDEFATQTFPTANSAGFRLEKILGSEILGDALTFGFGASAATASGGGTKHLATPYNPATGGLQLPYKSLIEQARPGSASVVDRMLFGNAVEGFTITIGTGPTREAAKIMIDYIGTGAKTEPSGFTMPAITPAHELKGASLTLNGAMLQVAGVDYVTAKTFEELVIGWKNNLTARYAPGGGVQGGAALATALEVGNRVASFTVNVRVVNGSDEFQKITNSTTGTAVINLTGSSFHAGNITFNKIGWKVAKFVNLPNGILGLSLEASIMNPGSGIMSGYAINGFAKQGAEP